VPHPDSAIDVVVIGAGPAGAGAARTLALRGWDVVLLAPPPARRPPLAESLPPSCRKPLSALGLLDAVEGAGFLPNRGTTAWWGGEPARTVAFEASGPGFQVDRHRLDALLLREAEAAGARVLHGRLARRVEPAPAAGGPGSWVHLSGPDGAGRLLARWVLDCSGRAGVVARRGYRARGAGPATAALVAVWRRAGGWPPGDEHLTLLEAYHDGWLWSVPLDRERRCVAAMVDPAGPGGRRGGLEAAYRAELAKARGLPRLLAGAVLEGRPWGCGATPYGARAFTGEGVLLVGDAGSFLDPLSSFGVKKALASAWLAAVAVHTVLARPAMREAALALFEERERAAHEHFQALTAASYAEAAARYPHPFWTARAAGAPTGGPDRPPGLADPAGLRADPAFAAAFERLHAAPRLRLRAAPGLARVRRPTVAGGEVVLADHLATPSAPAGVRFFRGVDLPVLVDLVAHHDQVPELFAAYGRRCPPAALPDFLHALSALLATGAVGPAPDGEPTCPELQPC
jgi:flavin-dependent dehydrogenase